MKEVTEKEFYNVIRDKNVRLEVKGDFPYTTNYVLKRGNNLLGKVVDSYTDNVKFRYPIVKSYFINTT